MRSFLNMLYFIIVLIVFFHAVIIGGYMLSHYINWLTSFASALL